jgi:aminoglycoside phosphotransferase (APT) family kinase protein
MMRAMPDPIPAQLSAWLDANVDVTGPFGWTRLVGGNSNHTYLVEGVSEDLILRRPPEATIDPSAHSMEREYRVMNSDVSSAMPADVMRPAACHVVPAVS